MENIHNDVKVQRVHFQYRDEQSQLREFLQLSLVSTQSCNCKRELLFAFLFHQDKTNKKQIKPVNRFPPLILAFSRNAGLPQGRGFTKTSSAAKRFCRRGKC